MKRNKRAGSSIVVTARRWTAYAVAGAASAAALPECVEAEIMYSGVRNLRIGPNPTPITTLDGAVIAHAKYHYYFVQCVFQSAANLTPAEGASVVGDLTPGIFESLANLPLGATVPYETDWTDASQHLRWNSNICGARRVGGQFDLGETGFAAFRFDLGHGTQFGWLRVTMGRIVSEIDLVDWAYADPDESIRVGQTAVPESGSLGLLAFGAAGLLTWRACQRQAGRDRLVECELRNSAQDPARSSRLLD